MWFGGLGGGGAAKSALACGDHLTPANSQGVRFDPTEECVVRLVLIPFEFVVCANAFDIFGSRRGTSNNHLRKCPVPQLSEYISVGNDSGHAKNVAIFCDKRNLLPGSFTRND